MTLIAWRRIYFDPEDKREEARGRLREPWIEDRARSWLYGSPVEREARREAVSGDVFDFWPREMRCLVRAVWVRDERLLRRAETSVSESILGVGSERSERGFLRCGVGSRGKLVRNRKNENVFMRMVRFGDEEAHDQNS